MESLEPQQNEDREFPGEIKDQVPSKYPTTATIRFEGSPRYGCWGYGGLFKNASLENLSLGHSSRISRHLLFVLCLASQPNVGKFPHPFLLEVSNVTTDGHTNSLWYSSIGKHTFAMALELEPGNFPWEGIQTVPDRRDYWSDCSCSNGCGSPDGSYTSEESNSASSEADTEVEAERQEQALGEDDTTSDQTEDDDGSESSGTRVRHRPSWEQLSSECVRQQIRELEDSQGQQEFFNQLGEVCSEIVESIKRQRVG